jgi:hypothetical protein
MTDNNTKFHNTHGVLIEVCKPEGCIFRKLTISKHSDGSYFITFYTQYNENEAIVENSIRLSQQAAAMLQQGLWEILMNQSQYEIKKDSEETL